VACVPEYVYDYRLLVTAKLVGIKGWTPLPPL
jgi:hypothetical protein